jgi:hypothetical protein
MELFGIGIVVGIVIGAFGYALFKKYVTIKTDEV